MKFLINFWRVTTFFMNVLFVLMTILFFFLTFGKGNTQLNFMLFLQSLILTKLSWDKWYSPENVAKGNAAATQWRN